MDKDKNNDDLINQRYLNVAEVITSNDRYATENDRFHVHISGNISDSIPAIVSKAKEDTQNYLSDFNNCLKVLDSITGTRVRFRKPNDGLRNREDIIEAIYVTPDNNQLLEGSWVNAQTHSREELIDSFKEFKVKEMETLFDGMRLSKIDYAKGSKKPNDCFKSKDQVNAMYQVVMKNDPEMVDAFFTAIDSPYTIEDFAEKSNSLKDNLKNKIQKNAADAKDTKSVEKGLKKPGE